MAKAPYATAQELRGVAVFIDALEDAHDSVGASVSLGDIPVVDHNGEALGKIVYEDQIYVFKP